MTTVGGYATVAEKLMELLNLSLPRTDVVPSEEICKRCYRQLNEIDFLEIQVFTFDWKSEIKNWILYRVYQRFGQLDNLVLVVLF